MRWKKFKWKMCDFQQWPHPQCAEGRSCTPKAIPYTVPNTLHTPMPVPKLPMSNPKTTTDLNNSRRNLPNQAHTHTHTHRPEPTNTAPHSPMPVPTVWDPHDKAAPDTALPAAACPGHPTAGRPCPNAYPTDRPTTHATWMAHRRAARSTRRAVHQGQAGALSA